MGVRVTGLDKVGEEIEKIVKKEIEFLADTYQSEVKKRTPIDTGRARRGWSKRSATGNNKEIRNKIPYIERLEGGYSKQAPRGFVNQSITSTLNKRKTR